MWRSHGGKGEMFFFFLSESFSFLSPQSTFIIIIVGRSIAQIPFVDFYVLTVLPLFSFLWLLFLILFLILILILILILVHVLVLTLVLLLRSNVFL